MGKKPQKTLMSKPKLFTLSTERINSYRIKILTDGIVMDDFKNNPLLLKEHVWSIDGVIGKWVNVRIEGDHLMAEPDFDVDCQDGKEVAGKVARGYLKAASIGGRILEMHEEKDENDETYYLVTKFLLIEASIVAIPSNKSCLRLYDADMKLIEDWKFSDFIPETKTPKKKNMDFKQIAKTLGLSEDASEGEILTMISQKNGAETQLADMQKKTKVDQSAEIVRLFDKAVSENRIGADKKAHFVKFGEVDFDAAKETIEALPKPATLSDIARGVAGIGVSALPAGKTFSDYHKAGTLTTLSEEQQDALYKDEFSVSMKADTFKER